jgi:prepilin-type N-terminal cleavage/methylation domain-containing protein
MITRKTPASPRLEPSKKGFTLTEIAIVLGIMGLILGAIWVAASGVYANQKEAKANTETLTIAQNLRSLYSTQATTGVAAATDITAQMITAGVFPADTVNGAVTVNPWNGTIGIIAQLPATANTFHVVLTNVPRDACINLLMMVAGSGRDPGLVSATAIANAAVAATDATAAAVPLAAAITMADATAAAPTGGILGGCGVGTPTKIRFGFLLK